MKIGGSIGVAHGVVVQISEELRQVAKEMHDIDAEKVLEDILVNALQKEEIQAAS